MKTNIKLSVMMFLQYMMLPVWFVPVFACSSAFVGVGFCDSCIELPEDEYKAFVVAHSNEVCFLGVDIYSDKPVHWTSFGIAHSDGPRGGRSCRIQSREVKLSHPVAGHREACLQSGYGDLNVGCLSITESKERKFALEEEKYWIKKTMDEITALTGIPIAICEVQSNKRVHAYGTNATLQIRVESSSVRRYQGPPHRISASLPDDWREQTARRVVVSPLFRRRLKPVPKTSEFTVPEIDVDT